LTEFVKKVKTYASVIINIGSDLVLLVFLGGVFRGDLTVRRDEDVARGHALAIVVRDLPFQGSDLGELFRVSTSGCETRSKKAVFSPTVTKDIKSASWRSATTLLENRSNSAAQNILN
jgi:hypothetical protein